MATADAAASVYIDTRRYADRTAREAGKFSRYLRWAARNRLESSDRWAEARILVSSPSKPNWFHAVQQRVRRSVLPKGHELGNDGQWLTDEVADAALEFFEVASGSLPSEPFIYSSRNGDLVAEFEGNHGTLTSIVSPAFVLLYAVVDGLPAEKKFPRGAWGACEMMSAIADITKILMTGRDGASAMESTK